MDEPTEPQTLAEGDRIDEQQKAQHIEQNLQAVRQTEQGLRQDEQGIRQDHGEETMAVHTSNIMSGQKQQDITNRITDAHTEQILNVQAQQEYFEHNLDRIISGVDLLATQVTILNDRVYTKNYLDRIRNWMLVVAVGTFLMVSVILGYTLYTIKEESKKEAKRSSVRAEEASSFRKQLADCTVRPGTILEDGTVNPGICFIENQLRNQQFLDSAVSSVKEELRMLLAPYSQESE